jgi:biotin carboxyl carrier protein
LRDFLYIVVGLTVWIGAFTFVLGIEPALVLTAAFLFLGIIGRYGSQALEDWLRGRGERKAEELRARFNERANLNSKDLTGQSITPRASQMLIKADLCGYHSATIEKILVAQDERVSKGHTLATLAIKTKNNTLELKVFSPTDGVISEITKPEQAIVIQNSPLFKLSF